MLYLLNILIHSHTILCKIYYLFRENKKAKTLIKLPLMIVLVLPSIFFYSSTYFFHLMTEIIESLYFIRQMTLKILRGFEKYLFIVL